MQSNITSFELLKQLLLQIPDDDSCIEWPRAARNKQGYGSAKFEGRDQMTHRVTWIITFGPIPDEMDVLHKCDNTKCFRPSHLFLGTHLQNMRDCVGKGRTKIVPKLTDQQVQEIRQLYAEGVKQVVLAHQFGVFQGNISKIILRKTWRHL